MRNKEKYDELKLQISLGHGNRYRLAGAGRKTTMPPELELMLMTKLRRLTLVHGGYSDAEFHSLISLYSSNFDNISIWEPLSGTPKPPQDGKTIYVDGPFKSRLRAKWNAGLDIGDKKTAFDPFADTEAIRITDAHVCNNGNQQHTT